MELILLGMLLGGGLGHFTLGGFFGILGLIIGGYIAYWLGIEAVEDKEFRKGLFQWILGAIGIIILLFFILPH